MGGEGAMVSVKYWRQNRLKMMLVGSEMVFVCSEGGFLVMEVLAIFFVSGLYKADINVGPSERAEARFPVGYDAQLTWLDSPTGVSPTLRRITPHPFYRCLGSPNSTRRNTCVPGTMISRVS